MDGGGVDPTTAAAAATTPGNAPRRWRVGYAMMASKAKKHLRPALLAATAAAGFDLIAVDPDRPLADQGPWDVLLHKIRTADFTAQLAAYASAHGPGLRLVDTPAAVARLQSRATMLDPLRASEDEGGGGGGLVLRPQGGGRPGSSASLVEEEAAAAQAAADGPGPGTSVRVGAPTQVVILPAGGGRGSSAGRAAAAALASVSAAGLAPPLLAKPLLAGGQPGAHALALLTDTPAIAALAAAGEDAPLLPGLAPPLILQPYVPHRPPLFKVFVIGPAVALARRPSLTVPPPPEDVTAAVGGALALARVSAYTSPADEAAGEDGGGGGSREGGGSGGDSSAAAPTTTTTTTPPANPDPPRWVLESLAAELRAALGLQIFNFDLIRVARDLMEAGEEEAGRRDGGGSAARGPCPPGADFLVIDINYFPGIEKLPGYEGLMVGFLQWVTGPEGTAATTGWEAGVAAAAAAAAAEADPPPPRPFPPRPLSGLQRLSLSLSQVAVPSRRPSGGEDDDDV